MEWAMWHRAQGRWGKANGMGRKERIGGNGEAGKLGRQEARELMADGKKDCRRGQ